MTAWLRRAGRGRLADGTELVWSVAEGTRGRRWRSMTIADGIVATSSLVEVGVDGRPTRLEVASLAGLLTLHPEPDLAAAHGNVVSRDGVRPLAFPWSAGHAFDVVEDPLVLLAAIPGLAAGLAVGEGIVVPVLAIAADLDAAADARRVVRQSATRWSVSDDARGTAVGIDERGIPVDLVSATEWALEDD